MIENQLYDIVHAGDRRSMEEWFERSPEDLNAQIGEGYTPLHVACIFGHEAVVESLLTRHALVNLNAANTSGANPLHLATCFRDEAVGDRIVRTLISHGAELSARQRGGQTALHHAVARNSFKLVETLIDAGADPLIKDDFGQNANDLAKSSSIRDLLKRAFSLSPQPL